MSFPSLKCATNFTRSDLIFKFTMLFYFDSAIHAMLRTGREHSLVNSNCNWSASTLPQLARKLQPCAIRLVPQHGVDGVPVVPRGAPDQYEAFLEVDLVSPLERIRQTVSYSKKQSSNLM